MTNLLLYRISGWIQIFIWLLLVVVVVKEKFSNGNKLKYFYIYLVIITILELLYAGLALFKIKNFFLDYIYKSVEFVFLGMYLQSIINSKKLYKVTLFLCVLFILGQFYNAFFGAGLNYLNDSGNLFSSCYLFMFSFLVVVFLLRKNSRDLLNDYSFNIILSIFLIFITEVLVNFLLKYAYQQHNSQAEYIILISSNFFKSTYLLLFLRGLLLIKR